MRHTSTWVEDGFELELSATRADPDDGFLMDDGTPLLGWINCSIRRGGSQEWLPLGGWWITAGGRLHPYVGVDTYGSNYAAACRALALLGEAVEEQPEDDGDDEVAERLMAQAQRLAGARAERLAESMTEE